MATIYTPRTRAAVVNEITKSISAITNTTKVSAGSRVTPQEEARELMRAQKGLATAHQIFRRLGGGWSRDIDYALAKIQSEVSSRIGGLGGY